MRIVSEAEIRAVVDERDARLAMRQAFSALAAGEVIAPDELAMVLEHGGELHVKGAYLGGDVIAFKAATGGFPAGGNSGFTAVLDAHTGGPTAILQDRGWLTEMRTAAAAALSAEVLAAPNPRKLALLGAGVQAGFQLRAMRDLFDFGAVSVWSRTATSAAAFAAEHNVDVAANAGAAVADADVVVCCTPSREPLLSFDQLKPGVHVVAMGSDMVGKRELAIDVLARADLLVADSVVMTSRVGELQHAPAEQPRAVDLGDVLAGVKPGRTSDLQISVCDLCGLGIQDAAMAELVMSRLG